MMILSFSKYGYKVEICFLHKKMMPVKNTYLYVEVMHMKSKLTRPALHIENNHSLSMSDLEYIHSHNVSLESLTMCGCEENGSDGWSDDKIDVLCEIIKSSLTTLKYVNLGYNDFTNSNAMKLIPVLGKCTLLEKVYIDHNSLGDKGLSYLFDTLKGLQCLKLISASNVATDGSAWIHRFNVFALATPSFTNFDLANNFIDEKDKNQFVNYKRHVILRN